VDVARGEKTRTLLGIPGKSAHWRSRRMGGSGQRRMSPAPRGAAETLKLWDVASGRNLATFFGHGDQVGHVAFSRDGKTLASCGIDGTIVLRLADRSGRSARRLKPPTPKNHEEYLSRSRSIRRPNGWPPACAAGPSRSGTWPH